MTDNELIAEFMGLPLTKQEMEFSGGRKFKTVPFQRWKYHQSWEWLMPVVIKINLIDGYSCLSIDHDTVYLHLKEDTMKYFEFGEEGVTMINAVYSAVVHFIKWYNKNKS